MIKFKYFNRDKLKKLGSTVLITTMLGTSACTLSGCGSNDKNNTLTTTPVTTNNTTPKEKKTNYAVVVEGDGAIVYDDIEKHVEVGHEEMWYCAKIEENFKIELPADTYVLENCTLNDAKEYAKGLVSENGTVKTYDIEQEKTFVKVK